MIRFWQPFRQANRWSQLSPSGTAPAARSSHTAVWCDVADGMYVFGGKDGSRGLSVNGPRDSGVHCGTPRLRWGKRLNDLHFFDRQAWVEFAGGVSKWIPREVWWGLMIWHNWFGCILWRRENVCETSCHRSTCLAPPFLDIFCIFLFCFHFYALVWRHM